MILRLHLLPTEHRVLVTHTAVKEATGHYYVRVYGDDKMHAKASSGKYTDKDGARPPAPLTPREARGVLRHWWSVHIASLAPHTLTALINL